MSKRILILVPHPDDEVLSFGGLMSKSNKSGDKIYVHCFCVGGPCSNVSVEVREKEFISVMDYFNCEYSFDRGMDGLLETVSNTELTRYIDGLINSYKPDEVYCGAMSEHSDHIALVKAFTASARLKSGWMPKLFALGTYQFSDQLYSQSAGGKIFNPLSEDDFIRKCEAFKLHNSQFKPSPSPLGLDGLEIQAMYNGMMCGHKYAELYYQLRYIRSL